jgi:hypothetical protein
VVAAIDDLRMAGMDEAPAPGARIVQLLASPITRYVGRPADGPLPAPPGELVERIEIRAGLGIVGDRYFNKPAHRDASVTIMAAESLPPGADLVQTRRNILIAGFAGADGETIDDLVGSVLTLDTGAGPVRFQARRRANPCAWMDATIGPGAHRALRRKGGIRCTPLDDGVLRIGPVRVVVQPST